MNPTLVKIPSIEQHYVVSHVGRSGEDRYITADIDDTHLFTVFDGHGGSGVVNYLKDYFVPFLAEDLIRVDMTDYAQVNDAIIRSFITLDVVMLSEELSGGSTAITILKTGNLVYIINLGDSRSVIFNLQGEIQAESVDHTPAYDEERIILAGGAIRSGRVNGILAVSRAFGDFYLKKVKDQYSPYGPVSIIPDVTRYPIEEKNIFALLGSDGLFELTTSQNLVDEIIISPNLREAAVKLTQEALERTDDDITTMVVKLS